MDHCPLWVLRPIPLLHRSGQVSLLHITKKLFKKPKKQNKIKYQKNIHKCPKARSRV